MTKRSQVREEWYLGRCTAAVVSQPAQPARTAPSVSRDPERRRRPFPVRPSAWSAVGPSANAKPSMKRIATEQLPTASTDLKKGRSRFSRILSPPCAAVPHAPRVATFLRAAPLDFPCVHEGKSSERGAPVSSIVDDPDGNTAVHPGVDYPCRDGPTTACGATRRCRARNRTWRRWTASEL